MLDGRQLNFRRRSSLVVLAYLAVTGRAATRMHLAALLSDDPTYGPVLLRNSLLELRAHLGAQLLIVGQRIALDPALAVRTDVAAFEEALATADEARTAQLAAASAAWRGEFLEGLALRGTCAFEEWQQLERERLHTLLIGALEELGNTRWREGRLDEALAYTRRLLAAEPWHEGAHRAVMLLLLQQGRRGEALAQYDVCRAILATELAAEPAPETAAIYQRIVAEAPASHNLPPEPAPLVGRLGELKTLAGWLDDRTCRSVAITGAGGMGKTHLALRVAAHYVEGTPGLGWLRFPAGVCMVALDALPPDRHGPAGPSAERIFAAIGAALGLPAPATAACVIAALREQTRLLILDNSEHLAGASLALEQLVAGAAGVTMLLTSRGAVPGAQHTLELGPLAIPACPAELEHAEASRLFLQAARRARLTFGPGAAERGAIVRICTSVGGLPLAVVQAAQLVRTMSCAAVAKLLAERPLDLNAPLRNFPPRHRSLRANIAYGWALLTASEQLAVRCHVEQGRASLLASHLGDDLAYALASIGLLARADGDTPSLPPLLHTFLVERPPS
jgi:DNA-binding SARP family transcriptional activator